jgi:hypothetical protein
MDSHSTLIRNFTSYAQIASESVYKAWEIPTFNRLLRAVKSMGVFSSFLEGSCKKSLFLDTSKLEVLPTMEGSCILLESRIELSIGLVIFDTDYFY